MTATNTAQSMHSKRKTNKIDIEIGFRIRKIRQQKEISLDTMAETLDVSREQVRKYELGINRISAQRLSEIASYLQVSVGFLLSGEFAANANGGMDELANQEVQYLWSSLHDAKCKSLILELLKIFTERKGLPQPKDGGKP